MKKFIFSLNELIIINNSLSEVCYGLNIDCFDKEIGTSQEKADKLLSYIDHYIVENRKKKGLIHLSINLNDEHIIIIINSIKVMLKHLDEVELHPRIGSEYEEIVEFQKKLEQLQKS